MNDPDHKKLFLEYDEITRELDLKQEKIREKICLSGGRI